jgi:Fe-Mn family superoxide dismutase
MRSAPSSRRRPFATAPGFQLNGLKREELIATNSMLLHELYFGSLGGDGVTMEPAMKLALDANFGSVERWRDEFIAMGKALGGGSGWVLLVFQPREGTLVNQWAADHTHAVAGGVPMLALDMYEHAYHMDYGAAAGAYVDAFMGNIDWAAVYGRYQRAVHAASEPFGAAQDEIGRCGAARRAPRRRVREARTMLPGARWCDPAAVGAGPPNCRPTEMWSSTASTATKSAAPRRCGCAPPGSTHATCAAASTAGKPKAGQRRPKERRHEVDHP